MLKLIAGLWEDCYGMHVWGLCRENNLGGAAATVVTTAILCNYLLCGCSYLLCSVGSV